MLKAIHKKQYNPKTRLSSTSLGNSNNKLFKTVTETSGLGFKTLFSSFSFKAIPIISGVTLAGVLAISGFIPATTPSSAYAEGSTGTVDLTANVSEPALALTLSSNAVTLNLSPSYQGAATSSGYITTTVNAGTSGYSLLMYGEPNLVNSTNTTVKITPDSNCLGQGCSLTNMASGTWGFSVGDNTDISTFKPMTSGYNVIDSRESATSSDSVTKVVKFGAKVDHEQLPGTYNTTLNFVAVARVNNANPAMQNLNSTYCNEVGPTLVTDSRDNKQYLVQRLGDGKCWMLDNLAFDPTAYTGTDAQLASLTNVNDVMNGETVAVSKTQIITALKSGAGTAGITNTSGQYASSGITANPNTSATAGLWGPTIGESTCNGLADQSVCTDNWTVPRVNTSNISKYQYPAWSPNSASADHDSSIPSYGSYNVGVYYNYCAVSAGSYCYSKEQGTGDATSDICPAGWRLPSGSTIGEFQSLYNAYGGDTAVNDINGYAFRAALSTPLAGGVDYSSGAISYVDLRNYYWSSTRNDGSVMYRLYINTTDVYPALHNYRPNGLTIRCVLKLNQN